MLDLNVYINNSVKVKLNDKELDVLEPSVELIMKVNEIESDLTVKNQHAKRVETALLFLNHNAQKVLITKEEVQKIPYEALIMLIAEVATMRYKADADPN